MHFIKFLQKTYLLIWKEFGRGNARQSKLPLCCFYWSAPSTLLFNYYDKRINHKNVKHIIYFR